jgi:predicted nuclease with RNAse H fold
MVWLEAAKVANSHADLIETLVEWVRSSERVVLSIDAPLGWPAGMRTALASHQAGAPIEGHAHSMFRRETDRFIRQQLGKQSLDVGADRIARTAFTALSMLDQVRKATRLPIPLAWDRDSEGAAAIEVYPAATLRAHQIPDKGYKAKRGQAERAAIVRGLEHHFQLRGNRPQLLDNVDVLDAAICVLAGLDFEAGTAMPPEHSDEVRSEGWIWARDPAQGCTCTSLA